MENKQVLSDYEIKREQQRVKSELQVSVQKLSNKIGIVAASALVGAIAEHITVIDDTCSFDKRRFFDVGWVLEHIGEYEFDAKLGGQYRPAHFPNAPKFEDYNSPEFEAYAKSKMGVRWNSSGCNKYGVYLDKKVEIEGWDKVVIHVTNN